MKNGEYITNTKHHIETSYSSPPSNDEPSESNSFVSDLDTTINLAQIERVNSMSMMKYNKNNNLRKNFF